MYRKNIQIHNSISFLSKKHFIVKLKTPLEEFWTKFLFNYIKCKMFIFLLF